MAMDGELLEPKPWAPSTGSSEQEADVETASGDHGKEPAAQQDLTRILPEDMLADVLRHLAPRWLAASRCVCRDWRATVDARRLLRADLLPLSFHGIFLHFDAHTFPELFARPSSSSTGGLAISGGLDFLPDANTSIKIPQHGYRKGCRYGIVDHCNGLLLLGNRYVVNPATRRCHHLPLCPPAPKLPLQMVGHVRQITFNRYLVFDPMVSPHYEVFVIPRTFFVGHGKEMEYFDPLVKESRWTSGSSSSWIFRVFSSKTGQWEEKSFVREEGAPRTNITYSPVEWRERAVYWRGALYLQRQANFVLRMSLSNNKYCLIEPPMGMGLSVHPNRYLERSEQGVYFAAVDKYRLRVWVLSESSGQIEWVFKHDNDLEHAVSHHRGQFHGPWVLKDVNYNSFCSHLPGYKKKGTVGDNFEWNSDSDDDEVKTEGCYLAENKKGKNTWKLIDTNPVEDFQMEDEVSYVYNPDIIILGFHPYREIVFLTSGSREKEVAYHLSTSKVEGIGNICPTNYTQFNGFSNQPPIIGYSFTYTPCWLEELARNI
ncbi:uncharacterized protein [Triticum aestivum]|uniref:uncharacterized protein n=1 Tax=Triticum aestivum TaxID=4565 RepID=UPI001D022522|nr:uncharacterized protein LOC123184674 [Triticum aestivum]